MQPKYRIYICNRYICIYPTYICIYSLSTFICIYGVYICRQQIHFFMCKQIIQIRIKNPLKFAMKTNQKQVENQPNNKTSRKQAKKLLHRTSPRCLCLCFRFYLISSASELSVRVCVHACVCLRVCVPACCCCVFSPFAYLLIVCCKRFSRERVSPALSHSLCYSLSLLTAGRVSASVCVCLALTSALRSFAVAFAFACAIRLKATIARGCLRLVSLSRVYRISLVPRLAKLSSKFASLENWQNKKQQLWQKREKWV